jgi:vesicle coat complex subunit
MISWLEAFSQIQHVPTLRRGVTLRFLCRITEADLLEPLIPSIVACLEHRHSFVRRNAVMAMDRIYQLPGKGCRTHSRGRCQIRLGVSD